LRIVSLFQNIFKQFFDSGDLPCKIVKNKKRTLRWRSLNQISSQLDKRLQRYRDLTVFKMSAVRHLGFFKFKFINGLRG